MKQVIHSTNAPQPLGPYSQAISVDRQVFLSGQVAIDLRTGELVDGDIAVHAERVLSNLGAVLEAAGLTYDDVVKTTVFLARIEDYDALNAVYAKFFTSQQPARATVAVAALPRGSLLQIDAVAIRPSTSVR
jgi:2-iminobutanoate/2-iminopropanoate deaminase